MPKPTPWQDEYTLLCERCGYIIDGLPSEANCPECGKPIAESLPERRPGTPWQRKPSPRNLWRTGWQTLRRPARTLDEMRFPPNSKLDLGSQYALLTGLWLTLSLTLPILLIRFTQAIGNGSESRTLLAMVVLALGGLGVVLLLGFGIAIIVAALTAIERFGLRFLSNRHGYRITRPIAQAITSHGSVGWLAGSLLGSLVSITGWTLAVTGLVHGSPWIWPALGAAILLAGFLYFETFAWLGLRRLKYANTQSPDESINQPHNSESPSAHSG